MEVSLMKKVIMIIGSNSSGKTSQAKLIHKNYNGTGSAKEIRQIDFINEDGEQDKTFVTLYDKSAHVGKMEDDTQCTGTDSLNSRARVEMAYLYLMLSTKIEVIVLDAILSTGTWSEMIHQVQTQQNIHTVLILLNYSSPEANYARLRQRRSNKTGQPVDSIILSDKTQENVFSKLKGFKNMFEKIKYDFNVYSEIDADLPAETIHLMITQLAGL